MYHQNYYKLTGIDLLRETNSRILKQINFTGKLEEKGGAKIFFMIEKQQKSGLISFKLISSKYQVLLA